MRIIVFYDLPITTYENKYAYQIFRNYLLKNGYDMLQYSVYVRLCNGYDMMNRYINQLKINLPSKGNIRIMTVTEKQYAQMLFLVGTPSKQEKKNTEQKQLMLF